MKAYHHLCFLLFVSFFVHSAQSQKLVPCNQIDPQTKVKKWGFCDCFYSDIVIKCQYDTTLEFTDGLGRVRQNGKYGYVDRTGKLVIPARFDGADEFSNGLAAVALDNKVFFIDKKGVDVFKKTFKQASTFSNGLSLCSNEEGKRGFIDAKGNTVIPFTLEAAFPFNNGLTSVRYGGEKIWKAINPKGEVVFTFNEKVKTVFGSFSDGLVQVYIDGASNIRYDYVNEKGNFICDVPYASAKPFKNGRAIIAYENKNRKSGDMQFYKYGLITKGGREIVPAKYACLEESPIPGIYFYGSESTSISGCSGFGLVDSSGKELTRPIYGNFMRLNDTTFLCKEASKYESLSQYLLLTTKGKELLSLKHRKKYFTVAGADTLLVLYSDAVLTGGTVTTVYNIHTGMLKENHTTGITIFEKQKLVLFDDWKYPSGKLMTAAGKLVMDKVQSHIPYRSGVPLEKMTYILLRKSEEKDYKLYNIKSGKYLAGDFGFLEGSTDLYNHYFSEGMLAARQKGKWGFMDSTGKFKIPAIYENVEDYRNGWAVVNKLEKGLDGDEYSVYINKVGKELPGIKAAVHNASPFKEGFAIYKKPYDSEDDAVYYINTTGKVIFKSESTKFFVHGDFSNGLAAVPNAQGKYGYINTKGELVIPYQFTIPDKAEFPLRMEFNEDGKAIVEKEGKKVVIDKMGNSVK